MAHQEPEQHIVSYGTYVLVWLGLLVLTGLTVAVAGTDLGNFSVWMAILIAGIKSLLVLFIFMHIRYESRLFTIMILIVLFALVIFISLTFFDVSYR